MTYNSYTPFEWDKMKAESNKIKHGISFYEAMKLLIIAFTEKYDGKI